MLGEWEVHLCMVIPSVPPKRPWIPTLFRVFRTCLPKVQDQRNLKIKWSYWLRELFWMQGCEVSIYGHTQYIWASSISWILFYIYTYIVLYQGENIIIILVTDDQITKCVFASKGIHATYLSLIFNKHEDLKLIQQVYLKNNLILDTINRQTIK